MCARVNIRQVAKLVSMCLVRKTGHLAKVRLGRRQATSHCRQMAWGLLSPVDRSLVALRAGHAPKLSWPLCCRNHNILDDKPTDQTSDRPVKNIPLLPPKSIVVKANTKHVTLCILHSFMRVLRLGALQACTSRRFIGAPPGLRLHA